jgi:hypothetical protein
MLATPSHVFDKVLANAFPGWRSARRHAKLLDRRYHQIALDRRAFRIRTFLRWTSRPERDDHFRRYDIASEAGLQGMPRHFQSTATNQVGPSDCVKPQRSLLRIENRGGTSANFARRYDDSAPPNGRNAIHILT